MKLTVDQLAQRLAAELGDHSVSMDAGMRASHVIDECQPALVCAPQTADQITAALRLCSEAKASVAPYGGGTALSLGNAPRAVDMALDLNRLSRVVEHDYANLTTTVEAGIPLIRLQQFLAEQKQFVPLDPARSQRATVGGVVATNLNGLRRSYYGSVRDLVIGIKVLLATGDPIKAGGKVVKNVAGYDMCKLFVGSLGTLGIITQITLRASPIPETRATWIASGSAEQVIDLSEAIARSPLLPAAVAILNPAACHSMNMEGAGCKLAVWCEGFAETVARHVRDAKAFAERLGLANELFEDSLHDRIWAAIGDFPLSSDRLIFRLMLPRAAIAAAIKTIESWQMDGFCPAIVADAMAGTVWIGAAATETAANQFPKLIAYAREQRGHAVMLLAPPKLKRSIDVWGAPPRTLALMRKIKEQFDPDGLLNPGRYIGGI
jgi:glycolate oxidase FAD binding subunit